MNKKIPTSVTEQQGHLRQLTSIIPGFTNVHLFNQATDSYIHNFIVLWTFFFAWVDGGLQTIKIPEIKSETVTKHS